MSVRRITRLLPVLVFAVAAPALRAERESFSFDPAHTQVGFKVRHFDSKVGGTFKKFSGTIEIDREKPTASSVDFKIEAATIDTGNENRDKHLNSADFFDTAKFPEIAFKSTKIAEKGKDVYEVTGDLTMHGVTKPVVLTVSVGGFAKGPGGVEKAGFEVAGKINRQDFGVAWNRVVEGAAMLSDDVDVLITVEANKKKPEAAAPPAPAK